MNARRYMLDTNTVSELIKGHAGVLGHVLAVPMASLCISAVTEGELRFGLARRPAAKRLHEAVAELLRRVEVLPWDSAVAECYGAMRAAMAQRGKALAPLDLMIAAHASAVGAVLVSHDASFKHCPGLAREDWAD